MHLFTHMYKNYIEKQQCNPLQAHYYNQPNNIKNKTKKISSILQHIHNYGHYIDFTILCHQPVRHKCTRHLINNMRWWPHSATNCKLYTYVPKLTYLYTAHIYSLTLIMLYNVFKYFIVKSKMFGYLFFLFFRWLVYIILYSVAIFPQKRPSIQYSHYPLTTIIYIALVWLWYSDVGALV